MAIALMETFLGVKIENLLSKTKQYVPVFGITISKFEL